jgi:hypothetical protein
MKYVMHYTGPSDFTVETRATKCCEKRNVKVPICDQDGADRKCLRSNLFGKVNVENPDKYERMTLIWILMRSEVGRKGLRSTQSVY